ncbi:MAG TPA: enoyl-CoA hydratase/isomerase family protein [Bacteroidia bacterium]|jgi:methylglutaconyl-CoA hydratase|nr:enoyl-CoA hydratase/isomerase family protein [Bacteroidia bacterium]
MTEAGNVTSAHKDGISTISFFHPQSNSLPGALLRKVAQEITRAGEDEQVKVIVLKSEGDKTFCAGASFDELMSIGNLEAGKHFFSGFAAVINAIRKAPKFVIVRVQGKAVGGGVGIACAGDYTLATDLAAVKLSELAVGIGPFVVGPAVERKTGNSAFTHMTINATEWQSASWAREKGMYMETHPDVASLDSAVQGLATRLAQSSPEAMRMLKKVLWEGTEHWDTLLTERAEMSGKLVLTEFSKNAINKFKAKG